MKTPAPGSDGKVDQKALDAAKTKAEGLLKLLQNGGNFEELAKKNSDDPGSAKNGGELPPFQHGAMVPEFEQAAFALQNKGQLSGLVKSQYGYHIIQLIDKQPAHTKAFEEVKPDIASVVKQQKQSKAADQLARRLDLIVSWFARCSGRSGDRQIQAPNRLRDCFEHMRADCTCCLAHANGSDCKRRCHR